MIDSTAAARNQDYTHPASDGQESASSETNAAMTTGDTTQLTVVIDDSEQTIPWKAGMSILESMREAGLRPPSSCEAGQCGTCIAVLKSGSVDMATTAALSAEDIADNLILTCQAKPSSGPVLVDFDDV